MRLLAASLALLGTAAVTTAPKRAADVRPARLGLAVELEKDPGAETEKRLSAELRSTGVTVFEISASWPSMEPSPGKYRLEDILRAARLLRQSGASVHLDLPLVSIRDKTVPADLAAVAFDNTKLSLRLGHLLDALEPALADCSTLSLGYEADVYFADKPEELTAYRRLFDGAVDFLKKKAPGLLVGVTTLAPRESPAPVVAAMLHQRSPALFYLYAPFETGKPYLHRPPGAIDEDWKRLLDASGGRPIAFPEVSYSSAAENGSSPEKQAEFIARMRHLVSTTDGQRLLFARYVALRDALPAPKAPPALSQEAKRRAAFLSHRGLQTTAGDPKPAWKEWVKAGK